MRTVCTLYIKDNVYVGPTYDVSEAEEGVRRGPATEFHQIKKVRNLYKKKSEKE